MALLGSRSWESRIFYKFSPVRSLQTHDNGSWYAFPPSQILYYFYVWQIFAEKSWVRFSLTRNCRDTIPIKPALLVIWIHFHRILVYSFLHRLLLPFDLSTIKAPDSCSAHAISIRRLSASFRGIDHSIVGRRKKHRNYRRSLSQQQRRRGFPVIVRAVLCSFLQIARCLHAFGLLQPRPNASVLLSPALLFRARAYLATSCAIQRPIVPTLGCETASCEP